jgi:LmbE family N-acetylglucosaminyl deacetylase
MVHGRHGERREALSGFMETVVVTAHPDDEVLWAGGFLLRHPGTTVICCSVPRRDSVRAWKFFDACERLGAKPRLIPATESDPDKPLGHLDVLDLSGYDRIITHNQFGEYGHLHHQNVHQYITKRYSNKTIWTFGYRPGFLGNIVINLTDEESERKLEALKAYNHIWPYLDRNIPKWEALLHRYIEIEGLDFNTETFDEYSP